MRKIYPKLIQEKFFNDSLLSNASFMVSTTIFNAILGIVFWKIITFNNSPSFVGILSTILSLINWNVLISKFSFDLGLRRYTQAYDVFGKNELINSVLNTIILSGILISASTLLFLANLVPEYFFLRKNTFFITFFIFIVVSTSFVQVQEALLVGERNSFYQFIGTVLNGSTKILFILIFNNKLEYILAMILMGFIIQLWLDQRYFIPKLIKDFKYKLGINFTKIKHIFTFSVSNFIIILIGSQLLLLPLIISTLIGEEYAGYYYIVYFMATMIYRIPTSFAQSFMIESVSNSNKVVNLAKRTLIYVMFILLLIIISVIVLGKPLLQFFGESYYQNGYNLLLIFSLTGIPVTIVSIYNSYQYYLGNTKIPILLQIIIVTLIISGSILFLPITGLIGIGISFFTAYGISSLLIIAILSSKLIKIRNVN